MTIKDLAIQAKVSTGTVDRVIHNRGGVSIKTKRRINDIIKKNNFKINSIASALAKKKEFTIATLMPNYNNDDMFWESPYLGVKKASYEIEAFGFKVINYTYSQTDLKNYLEVFKKLIKKKPNGIIIVPGFNVKTKQILKKLESVNIPYFFLNINLKGFNNLSFIGQDSYKSGYLAAKLLHNSIGENPNILTIKIGSHLKNETILERIKGFDEYFLDKLIESSSYNILFKSIKFKKAISKKLNDTLKANPEIKGIFVPSGRVGLISNLVDKKIETNFKIVGYDTTPINLKCLKKNKITFLISQKSFYQGYNSILHMSELLSKKIIPKKKIFSPIEIVTKENMEFINNYKENFEQSYY